MSKDILSPIDRAPEPDRLTISCEKCGKLVDSYRIVYETETIPGPYGFLRKRHTGYATVTISCHGEKWQIHLCARSRTEKKHAF